MTIEFLLLILVSHCVWIWSNEVYTGMNQILIPVNQIKISFALFLLTLLANW